ncbi:sugar dehydrogenase complex small subunit [Neorhizobium sp. JUb45]|uniref:sugar dehydrogenase complex small subunit n=1 Tax=Neorhizobium sp. JUb45 TaxID=2485113 RepID=UPI0010457D83|nr:sugar dehydrogenase complex small subunit [Neorhizobium sp. JUb45]TCQ99415.1 D-sorbitol dehydrogenase-like protein [Neorhizobium sp. JUb45]
MKDCPQADPSSKGLSRRNLLKALTYSVPAAWLATGSLTASGALAQVAATAKAPADFMRISRLLTGHPEIDDTLADMAWSALVRRDDGFEAAYASLVQAIQVADLQEFTDLPQSPAMSDPAHKAAAVSLISAWYLGRVGEVLERAEPGPDFITYTGALMWRPTLDVTVLPTYARAGPGYWAAAPASLATD